MPNYKPIINNREVTDVLCLVVAGYSIKDMIKKLKQPQSTVSEKVRFLIKSKVIKKDKWKFEPKRNVITKLFQRQIRVWFERHLNVLDTANAIDKLEGIDVDESVITKIKEMIGRIPEVFNEERVSCIMGVYSDEMIRKPEADKMSISELANNYMESMKVTPLEEFNRLGNDIREVKTLVDKIKFRNHDQLFFERVEKYLAKLKV